MEQHPIPQQISSYQFKLVGDMTLAQFLKAAGGIVGFFVINALPLFVLIKLPLMAISAIGGLAIAFVPFEDRPLETWVTAFIKSIYSPTIFTWKKRVNKNWMDIDNTKAMLPEKEAEEVLPKKDDHKVEEFIKSIPSIKVTSHKSIVIEEKEDKEKAQSPKSKVQEENEGEDLILNNQSSKEEVVEKDWRDEKSDLNLKTEKLGATGRAVFGEIPMPDTPETPNLLVGMVTDQMGKIIDGAIVEIQDSMGNPNRVLKTNALGQFKISAPLANGTYLVIPEKEGLKFDRVNVNLSGGIVPPIKIQAI